MRDDLSGRRLGDYRLEARIEVTLDGDLLPQVGAQPAQQLVDHLHRPLPLGLGEPAGRQLNLVEVIGDKLPD